MGRVTLSETGFIRPAQIPGFSTVRGRNILVFILLIAFSLQGVVAQSHNHGALTAVHSLSAPVAETRPETGLPSDDEAHCLLCQAAALADGLSAPAAAAMPMAVQILLGVMAIPSPRILMVRAAGHEWRQRAPPRP